LAHDGVDDETGAVHRDCIADDDPLKQLAADTRGHIGTGNSKKAAAQTSMVSLP
jgi:hypothetical protein